MKSVKSAPSSKEPVLHLKGTQAFITKYSPVGSSVGIAMFLYIYLFSQLNA